MAKELRRFLWGILGIMLLFFTIQNFQAVTAGLSAVIGLGLPLLYGCAIAFLLNLIVRQLEKVMTFGPFRNQMFRRITAIILSLLILLGVVSVLIAGVVPEIRDSGALLVERLPGYMNGLIDFCINRLDMPASWFSEWQPQDIIGVIQTLFQNGVIQKLIQSGGTLVGGALTGMLDWLVGLCFSFYLLMQKESMCRNLKRLSKAYLKPETHEKVVHVGKTMNEIYSGFISGQCLDAVILGCMVSVTLAVLRIPYALLIGIVIAFTALVPVVGAFLGGFLGVFLLMMVSVKQAVVFLVVFMILQQVDNRLIYPHVVGNAVGLPAVWIFVAIVIGANFGGIFGMIFAIPFFALIYSLLCQNLRKREQAAQEAAALEEHEQE